MISESPVAQYLAHSQYYVNTAGKMSKWMNILIEKEVFTGI